MTSPAATRLRRLALDPVKFSRGFYKPRPRLWKKQRELLRSVRDNRRTAYKACHASSKTFTAALAAIWWVAVEKGIVITTAPSWTQVESLLWSEIHSRLSECRLDLPEPNKTFLSLGPKNYLTGISTNQPVRFRGWHGKVLVIIDEAVGVEGGIYDEVEGMMSGGDVRLLALSQPTVQGGKFWDAYHEDAHMWAGHTINAQSTPNFRNLFADCPDAAQITDGAEFAEMVEDLAEKRPDLFETSPYPFLTRRDWVLERVRGWYRKGDPQWAPKVLGQFPTHSVGALIWLDWLELSKTRDIRFDEPPESGEPDLDAAVDPAGEGQAKTAVCVRQENTIGILEGIAGGEEIAKARVLEILDPLKPRLKKVRVDVVGMGLDMFNFLKVRGFPVTPVNVGVKPVGATEIDTKELRGRYLNERARLHWRVRELLQSNEMALRLPSDLVSQFTTLRWHTNNVLGLIQIEKKEDLASRGIASPDELDSLCLSYHEPPDHSVPDLPPAHW